MSTDSRTGLLDAYMPTNPFWAGAWLGALRWALTDEKVLAQFRKDTGNRWVPATSPLDKMIDEATEAEASFIEQFAKWFNERLW